MSSNKNESVCSLEADVPNVPFTDYERRKLDEAWYTAQEAHREATRAIVWLFLFTVVNIIAFAVIANRFGW